MWYNALTKARELSIKTVEEIKQERRKSSLIMTPEKGNEENTSNKLASLPYFKEETLLDEKLNKIWSE